MQCASLQHEDERISHHLALAEREVRGRDVSHLSVSVLRLRAFLLNELHAYRLAGRFPRNVDFDDRTPYFIDGSGTRCAMAHLLELAGATHLVARVARLANNARIHELASDPELLRWLSAMGFTVADAAKIQPDYCAKKAYCYCDEGPSHAALADATFTIVDGGGPTVRIDAIRSGSGFAVGELVRLSNYGTTAPGAKLLVTLYGPASGSPYALPLPRTSVSFKSCAETVSTIPLSESDMIAAVSATDCVAKLVARDARFDELLCYSTDAGVVMEAGPKDSSAGDALDSSSVDSAISDAVHDSAVEDDGRVEVSTLDAGAESSVAADAGTEDTSIVAVSDAAPGVTQEASGGGCSFGHPPAAASGSDVAGALLAMSASIALARWRRTRNA